VPGCLAAVAAGRQVKFLHEVHNKALRY